MIPSVISKEESNCFLVAFSFKRNLDKIKEITIVIEVDMYTISKDVYFRALKFIIGTIKNRLIVNVK